MKKLAEMVEDGKLKLLSYPALPCKSSFKLTTESAHGVSHRGRGKLMLD